MKKNQNKRKRKIRKKKDIKRCPACGLKTFKKGFCQSGGDCAKSKPKKRGLPGSSALDREIARRNMDALERMEKNLEVA